MPEPKLLTPRVLVVIAHYGTSNDPYLRRLLYEYQSMNYAIDIVVCSDRPCDLGEGIQVIVGLPTNDPWSLPFRHKQVFANRIDRYDLFIYSEDDMLITQANITAFLQVTSYLAHDEIAGFMRSERAPDGYSWYPDVHLHYHWDCRSVASREGLIFARFTNEHAAAYMLTRDQLRRAIASGGFLVAPHATSYDMLVSAATDPYTQCGFKKVVCVSRINEFLIHHLPDRYLGRLGVDQTEFEHQIGALLRIAHKQQSACPCLPADSYAALPPFAKSYYEPARQDLIDLVPRAARSVLSIGCGWGATEEQLSRTGRSVSAIPLDSVIGTLAEARGIKIIYSTAGECDGAPAEVFDCLLVSNVLHLFPDPGKVLSRLSQLLSPDGSIIVAVPNGSGASTRWRRLRTRRGKGILGGCLGAGAHPASHSVVRRWAKEAGLRVERSTHRLSNRVARLCSERFTLLHPLLSAEIIAVVSRRPITGRDSLLNVARSTQGAMDK